MPVEGSRLLVLSMTVVGLQCQETTVELLFLSLVGTHQRFPGALEHEEKNKDTTFQDLHYTTHCQ